MNFLLLWSYECISVEKACSTWPDGTAEYDKAVALRHFVHGEPLPLQPLLHFGGVFRGDTKLLAKLRRESSICETMARKNRAALRPDPRLPVPAPRGSKH